MKGRSSRQGSKGERGVTKNTNLHHKLKEEPHLSGAYIRDLVKQLTSSRIKDPMNPNEPNTMDESHKNEGQRLVPPQHKKQVRRRLHTTRPYQERLLNMAEARREIVTALKLHRATMKKQANEPQNQQNFEPNLEPPLQEENVKSRRNSRTYLPKESTKYPLNQPDSSYYNMSHSTFYPSSSSNPYSSYWPSTQITNFPDNLNFALPSQTLGLNLNFQEFNNLDKTLYQRTENSACSYSSPKSNMVSSEGESSGIGLHQAIDEEEMAEIKSLGQQHEVEWNDTVNLVTSAKWFKFLKNSEKDKEDAFSPPFDDEVAQFPDWLNEDGNSSCFEQDYVIDNYLDDHCLKDPALPCLDIGEIEGLDGEWLG